MKHLAGHGLPISNGWSGGTGEQGPHVAVWCGRCRDYFTPDEAWANRYYDSQRAKYERGGFNALEWRSLSEAENRQALDGIEKDRAHLLNLLLALQGAT